MSSYDDVPTINALHAEQQLVQQALTNLSAGGTMINFAIGALPSAAPPALGEPMPMMAVTITVTEPLPVNVMNQIEHWLQQEMKRINDELATLGVTDTPQPPAETKSA